MTRFRSVVIGAVVLLSLGATPPTSPTRAWPWFIVIRGGGLPNPVLVGRRMNDMNGDVIRIFESLNTDPSLLGDYATRRHYEVAEFWGPEWFPDTAGHPMRTPRFEQATGFAEIYIGTARKPPVWLGRSDGRDGVARAIGGDGQKVLEAAGIKLR